MQVQSQVDDHADWIDLELINAVYDYELDSLGNKASSNSDESCDDF